MTTNNQLHLAIAKHIAEGIAFNRIDDLELNALHSNAGLLVGTVKVWHQTADDKVIAWLGSEIDPNMRNMTEMPVVRASLYEYHTGSVIRPATLEELTESQTAAKWDNGAGCISVDGITCYVIED